MLDVSHMATLLGTSRNISTNVNDLVTGKTGNVTTAALTPYSDTSNLKRQQVTALQNLKDYVSKNIDDDEVAAKLAQQIAATEALMEMNAKERGATVDPIFSLLSQNANPFSGLQQGSIIDQLI